MKNYKTILYGLIIIRIIIPYLLQSPVYEPHRDEFLYLAEGNHLAFGFMEVPPLLSVFAWLTHLFGNGMFWIKLWPSLFGAATFFIAAKIVLSLGGRGFALWLLFLSFTFTVYLRTFFLFQPNAPEIFFWTMIVYSMLRYVQKGENKWLYVFGVSVGLGMLTKYSVAFYTVSVLAGLLFTKHRIVFTNKHFWFASLVGFLIFLPNLLWQYANHFPVIFHMKELQKTQLQYISPVSFLIDQVVMYLPCCFIWIAGLYCVAFSRSAKSFRFIALVYFFVIIILIIGHGKNYYSMGAYPVLFAFGAYQIEQFTTNKSKVWRYLLMIPVALIGAVFLPLALPLAAPEKLASVYEKTHSELTGALKWEDLKNHPLPQDFSDMLGWEEMTKKAAAAYNTLNDDEKKRTLVFCNNYGMAGALNYYGKKYRLPEAYSDNASFLYWLPENKIIDNLILVTDNENELQEPYIRYFTSAIITDSVTSKYARERGDKIMLAKGANAQFARFFMQKIKEDKEEILK